MMSTRVGAPSYNGGEGLASVWGVRALYSRPIAGSARRLHVKLQLRRPAVSITSRSRHKTQNACPVPMLYA